MATIEHHQFSLWAMLGSIATAAVVVAGATWSVAKVTESNELEGYRRAKEWKAAESIDELRKLSTNLNITIQERKQLATLRDSAKRASELEARLVTVTAERDRFLRTISAMSEKQSQHTVKEGESSYLVPNTLLLAVVTTYPGINRCEVRVASDEKWTLEIGESKIITSGQIDYRLTLTKVSSDSCQFSFSLA